MTDLANYVEIAMSSKSSTEDACRAMWYLFNHEHLSAQEYNALAELVRMMNPNWREFLEANAEPERRSLELICGYKGDPVCFPPNCGGACPTDKPDLRPRRTKLMESYRLDNLDHEDFDQIDSASFAEEADDVCRLRLQIDQGLYQNLSDTELRIVCNALDAAYSSLLLCIATMNMSYERRRLSTPPNRWPSLARVDD